MWAKFFLNVFVLWRFLVPTSKDNIWNIWAISENKKVIKNWGHVFFTIHQYNMLKWKITEWYSLLELGVNVGQNFSKSSINFTKHNMMFKLWCIDQFIVLNLFLHRAKENVLKALMLNYDHQKGFMKP